MVSPRVLVLACGAILSSSGPARSAKFPPCTGHFVAHETASLITGSTVATDTIAIEGATPRFTVALVGGCPPKRVHPKGTKAGTKVVCTWKKNECGIPAKVKLKGLIVPGCGTLRGAVKTSKAAPVSFTAPSCGDGVVDGAGGETCDGAVGCDAGLVCFDCRCVSSIPTTTTTTLPGDTVSFARDVQPIFPARCAQQIGCHGASPGSMLLLSSGGEYAALTNGKSTEPPCTGAPLVVPGSPDTSVLVKKLTGTSCGFSMMPLGGPALSAADIAKIRDWIAEGAPNN